MTREAALRSVTAIASSLDVEKCIFECNLQSRFSFDAGVVFRYMSVCRVDEVTVGIRGSE